jgi:hypothetical protein
MVRMIQFAAGLAYLWLPCRIVGSPGATTIWLLFAICAVAVAAVLSFARRRGTRIRMRLNSEDSTNTERSSFAIRHLLAWTFVAAILIRVGQVVDYNHDSGILFGFGLAFTTVACPAPWFALAAKRLWVVRTALYVLVSSAIGALGAVADHPSMPDKTDEYLFFAAVGALDALILLFSLGMLRLAGLRLMPSPTPPTSSTDAGPPADGPLA